MTFAFASHLSCSFARPTCCNIKKCQNSQRVLLVSRAEFCRNGSSRDDIQTCCLDSSRAVFPTFWWGGIWPGASANAILFRSPYHIRFSSFLLRSVSFRDVTATHPRTLLRFSFAHKYIRHNINRIIFNIIEICNKIKCIFIIFRK